MAARISVASRAALFLPVLIPVTQPAGERLVFFRRFFRQHKIAGITANDSQCVDKIPQEKICLVQNFVVGLADNLQPAKPIEVRRGKGKLGTRTSGCSFPSRSCRY
mgnify:CR=1 FL=1